LKKLLTAFFAVALFISIAAVSPANAATISNLKAASSNGSVTVAGNLGTSSGATVTIKVASGDNIVYLDQTKTGADGAFTFSFKMSLATYGTSYTASVNGDNVTAPSTVTFTYAAPSSGGGGPIIIIPTDPVTPPAKELPPKALDDLKDKLKNPPATGEGGQPATANEAKKQAAKAAENAIKEAAQIDASGLVKTEGGVSKVELTADSLKAAFESVKSIATQVNAVLKENDPNAAPAKVVATINLGTVTGDSLEVPLSQDVVKAAKEQGIDVIAVEVNGVTLEIDLSTLSSDTTMTIQKKDSGSLEIVSNSKKASDVYSFEFTDANGNNVNFTKPVTLILPVNDVTGIDTDLLTLAKIIQGKLEYYGGKYNSDRTFTASRSSFSDYVIVENIVKFNDIASVQAWAGKAIETSASKGIIAGRGEGAFDPQGDVTRAEFATLLVKALGLQNDKLKENFDDVQDGAWYQQYVAAAVNAGLVNGRSAKIFDPNSKISRDEIATMTANALKRVLDYSDVASVNDALAKFTDAGSIRDFAKSSVALLTEEGIVQGRTATSFDPAGYATRAEAAVLIYKLFNLI